MPDIRFGANPRLVIRNDPADVIPLSVIMVARARAECTISYDGFCHGENHASHACADMLKQLGKNCHFLLGEACWCDINQTLKISAVGRE